MAYNVSQVDANQLLSGLKERRVQLENIVIA